MRGVAVRCDRASGTVGGDGVCGAMDANNEAAERFYRHFGFVGLERCSLSKIGG